MFTLPEITDIRKKYMFNENGELQSTGRSGGKPISEMTAEEKSYIESALFLQKIVRTAERQYNSFSSDLTPEEFLESMQQEFTQQALTGKTREIYSLAGFKNNGDYIWSRIMKNEYGSETYFRKVMLENNKSINNFDVKSVGGQSLLISYDLVDISRNPFVASLNPNNSQYTQPTTEVQLSSDVAAKKRAFVDRLIEYYDMMEHDDWYKKRLANEDRNMQKVANIVNHHGLVAPVENIGSLVRLLKAAKNLSIDGEKDYLEAIILQPEVHKALVVAKQEKKYDKIKEEALRCQQEGKVTTQGLREGHQLSQGEKELRSANNLVGENPNAVTEARATLASKTHISFGTTTDDIKLSNLYCLVARTQGKIPSKQRTYDTIEFDSGTEQGR